MYSVFETRSFLLSNKMLAELMDVLWREKFEEVKPSKVGRFLSLLAGRFKARESGFNLQGGSRES